MARRLTAVVAQAVTVVGLLALALYVFEDLIDGEPVPTLSRRPCRHAFSIQSGGGAAAGAVFFAAAFLTGAPFFAAFVGAFTAVFLLAAFFLAGAAFFVAAFAFAALTALAFFRFATSFAYAAESFRFGFVGSAAAWVGSDSPRILAHLAFCAIAIFRLEAALNLLRFLVGEGVAAVCAGPPGSMARSSAIWTSIRAFCAVNPSMAAVMISFVNLGVGM